MLPWQNIRAVLEALSRCELFGWRGSPAERLAEIIVLDQFSRNVRRGTPRAFAQDALALALAQELVWRGDDAQLPAPSAALPTCPVCTASPWRSIKKPCACLP